MCLGDMARVPEGGVVLDPAGYPRDHVQYFHVEGGQTAQLENLHNPAECIVHLRHLLRIHHPAVHEGRQERYGGGCHRRHLW